MRDIGSVASTAAAQDHPGASGGTATSESPQIVSTRPGNTVTYEIGDALNMAYVERDRLESVDVVLRRRRARFQGRIGRQRVEIDLQGSHIGGVIGDRPISLQAGRARGQLHVDGMFGAREIGSSTLSPSEEELVSAAMISPSSGAPI